MKERSLIAKPWEVRPLLNGRKTQTRRVVKLPSHIKHHELDLTRMQDGYPDGVRPIWGDGDEPNLFSTRNPYGQPGDRLWVRETFTRVHPAFLQHLVPDPDSHEWSSLYKADTLWGYESSLLEFTHWLSPAVMPRRFSRIEREIISVRVERLNEITEEDAKAEGIEEIKSLPIVRGATRSKCWRDYGIGVGFFQPIQSFRSLWESINGHGSWETNPWVWVVE